MNNGQTRTSLGQHTWCSIVYCLAVNLLESNCRLTTISLHVLLGTKSMGISTCTLYMYVYYNLSTRKMLQHHGASLSKHVCSTLC